MTARRPRTRPALGAMGIAALFLVGAAGSVAPASADGPEAGAVIPLRFRVVHIGGRPTKSKRWLARQIRVANRVFAPTGLRFQAAGVAPLSGEHAVLDDRHDRNQLSRYLERGVVNVYVVGDMRDVDNQNEWRRGVHWRLPWQPDQHFLVLTSIAPPTTLAHELGHYFGNRRHRMIRGNIMSYDHGPRPRFDPDQERRVRDTARTLLRSHQLYTMPTYLELVARGRLPSHFYTEAVRRRGAQRRGRQATLR